MKKMLAILSGLTIIGSASSTVVSCGLKQSQLSFNLADWKNSWAFNTQSIWQALAKNKTGVKLQESDGFFLDNNGEAQDFNQNFLEKFDHTPGHKSDPDQLETYLQLRYFVPSIISYNEKPYNSMLKNSESIQKNFTFEYQTVKGPNPSTKVIPNPKNENNLDEDQRGPVCELILGGQNADTLNAYFDVTIKLNPQSAYLNAENKLITQDGYYIDTDTSDTPEESITWTLVVYFTVSLF